MRNNNPVLNRLEQIATQIDVLLLESFYLLLSIFIFGQILSSVRFKIKKNNLYFCNLFFIELHFAWEKYLTKLRLKTFDIEDPFVSIGIYWVGK